jgi:hypothetical protein
MGALAIDYTYRYLFDSQFEASRQGPRLRLATFGGAEEHPYFFQGRICQPERAAELLRGLAEIVQARFHLPGIILHRLADPVVTSSEGALRFEAFSSCCSAYARVDFLPAAFDGKVMGRGTTNVDFNSPFRAALARIRAGENVGLAVGSEAVELTRATETLRERRVALPLRWLKGFVEVQSCQARMQPRLDISGAEAHRFFRAMPRGTVKEAWVTPLGRGLRLSQRRSGDAVRVAGLQRLRVLEDLAHYADRLRVYVDEATQANAWELVLGEAHFWLGLSPETWRGFSGEGQALERLASRAWQRLLPRVQAALTWGASIDAAALARKLRAEREHVTAALAALGARGLVGYDLARAAFYQRVLPFDLTLVESLQPRLQAARKLVEAGGIRILRQEGDHIEAMVPGSGVQHHVCLSEQGARCTCPWYAKHQDSRGPCKHVLAAQIMTDEKTSDDK